MLEITLSALASLRSSHWILDGFPRTLQQGMMLDEALTKENRPLNLIVSLGVDDDTILRRIAGVSAPSSSLRPDTHACSAQIDGFMFPQAGCTTRLTTSPRSRAGTM